MGCGMQSVNAGGDSDPRFWREVLMTNDVRLSPGNVCLGNHSRPQFYVFTGHGGISWLVVPLCFPSLVVPALIEIAKESDTSRGWYKSFFKITIPAYIAAALPLRLLGPVAIYSCTSVRDPQLGPLLAKALSSKALLKLRSVRLDPHEPADTCVAHSSTMCHSACGEDS
jgi:hypothetical protein